MNATQITAKIETLKARKNILIENSYDCTINQRTAYRAEIAEIEAEIDRLNTVEDEKEENVKTVEHLNHTITVTDKGNWLRVEIAGVDWSLDVDKSHETYGIVAAKERINLLVRQSTPRSAGEQTTTDSDETTQHINAYVQQTLLANNHYERAERYFVDSPMWKVYRLQGAFADVVAVSHLEALSNNPVAYQQAIDAYDTARNAGLHWTQIKI